MQYAQLQEFGSIKGFQIQKEEEKNEKHLGKSEVIK